MEGVAVRYGIKLGTDNNYIIHCYVSAGWSMFTSVELRQREVAGTKTSHLGHMQQAEAAPI